MSKVLLVLVDGMRPDALGPAGHPLFGQLKSEASYTLNAQTVFPSVTLPCHMSLFHSVPPQRHGITTNIYMPQVRPIRGLFDVTRAFKRTNAFFYNWEQLRDLARPDALAWGQYVSGHVYGFEEANEMLADAAAEFIVKNAPDCVFLYLGFTDEAGHGYGWLSDEYLRSIRQSFDCITRVLRILPADYRFILTADHGGHDRSHGTTMPEDMTIPMFLRGPEFAPGAELENVSILDIAPTITKLLGVPAEDEWEGKPLF